MTTNLETIKAEYLSLFNASIPRLKELAIALRAEDGQIPPDSGSFWNMTSNPRKNYELCQLAQDLESMTDFWELHPDNPQSSPTNDQEGDRLSNLKTNTGLLMDKLFKIEALLKLIEGSMSDSEDSSAIRLAVELVENALDFTDTWIDSPISRI